jgi:hypothetical protein
VRARGVAVLAVELKLERVQEVVGKRVGVPAQVIAQAATCLQPRRPYSFSHLNSLYELSIYLTVGPSFQSSTIPKHPYSQLSLQMTGMYSQQASCTPNSL